MDSVPLVPDSSTEKSRTARSDLHRLLHGLAEPAIVFPLIAVAALGVLWTATLKLITVERERARHAAVATAQELLGTYEAQVVRALGEIDDALKTVQYAWEVAPGEDVLADLEDRDLLPPSLLFTVRVADRGGNVVASTGPSTAGAVATEAHFQGALAGDSLAVAPPARTAGEGWRLRFGRRLERADGAVEGVALLELDASFFVSGYEPATLGEDGLLALVGTDGVVRARRSGDLVAAGDAIAVPDLIPDDGGEEPAVFLAESPWDGVRRYTVGRTLYGFPLAVVVGLSEKEQLASAGRHVRTYLWRAGGASLLLVLIVGALGRLSWKLARAREREHEARVAHAERVEYLAYHDSLTGLPNRSFFGKLLERAISQARRYGRELAVLFLDLDQFKQINDTLGHEAGDELLREVARRLRSCLRDSDTVARLGGDEFVVLLPEASEVESVARKVLDTVSRPFTLLGQEFRITASVGASLYPRDGEDEQTLTKHADIAMYEAKGEGRDRLRYFDEEMSTSSLERLALESSLRRALEYGEFQLEYQPRRGLPSGRITGVEALLRWQHPEFGLLTPRKFLPVAEETGLILPIGRWVLETACRQNVRWQSEGLPRLGVAVNLTATQFFDEGLLEQVVSAVEESGMDFDLLELEVSESTLTHDIERSTRILKALKETGIRIVVDNFGTGYSSLSTLRRLPLDSVKIDRVLVRDESSDAEDKELTDAVVAMGRTLSFRVVAQGVETEAQADFLRRHSCDEVQGFYFNRPLPPEDCTELLRDDAAKLLAAPAAPGSPGG